MKRAWWTGLALLGACYSMTVMQEPKPLDQGAVRGSAGLAFDTGSAGPSFQMAGRVGLGAASEARLKLSFPGNPARSGENGGVGGVEAGFGYQPYDSETLGLFLMPHYRYYAIREDVDGFFDESGNDATRRIQAFAMPMLVVFHLGWYELFLGPDVQAGTREKKGFLALGGHLGASLRAGKHAHITLETGLVGAVAGPHGTRDQYGDRDQHVFTIGDLIGEVGFSVSFGSAYR